MKGLSKGRYDETFAGEDDRSQALDKGYLSLRRCWEHPSVRGYVALHQS